MNPLVPVRTALSAMDVPTRVVAWLAPVLLSLAAAAALYGGFQLWDWWDDRQAVSDDRDKANAEALEKQVKAERKAGAEKAERDAEDRRNLEELENEAEAAADRGDPPADAVWNSGLFDDAS